MLQDERKDPCIHKGIRALDNLARILEFAALDTETALFDPARGLHADMAHDRHTSADNLGDIFGGETIAFTFYRVGAALGDQPPGIAHRIFL